ncbi:response regulator transcription factor [Streptomyces sp. YPW6]|uniref:helix-turn-helix transcriptional regulator n=1 Tax=Streptomyces sp. YPW6 TaxID=2840373 RepID=UPI003D7603D2
MVSDTYGEKASLRVEHPLRQTGMTAVVAIPDSIRRYSVEGMLRSLDIQFAVQSVAGADGLSNLRNGHLVILSSDALSPLTDDIAQKLRTHCVKVLILVDSTDVVEQSWVDHASGFLDWSDLRPESLREALIDVRDGRFHVSPALVRRSVTAPEQAGDETGSKRASTIELTAREQQVLRLISKGLSNRQVARSLSISEHGVKRAVGIILAKLNCPNRTLAVVRAMEWGLLAA